jgi:uncharacterized membrane protein
MKLAGPIRIIVAVALLLPAVAPRAALVLTSVSYDGFNATELWDINNAGTIVGQAYSPSRRTGFIYSGGAFSEIAGPTGAIGTLATGISDTGTIVGSWFGPDFVYRGFILEAGVYTVLDAWPGAPTFVRGVSPNGRFVTGQLTFPNGYAGAFLLDRERKEYRLVGNESAIAQGVNDAGLVVGSEPLGESRVGFFFDSTTGTKTAFPSSSEIYAPALRGIDPTGSVISGLGFDTTDFNLGIVGFFGPRDSPELFQAFNSNQTVPYGFNDRGQLVGFYAADPERTQYRGFIATYSVPEPGAVGLLLLTSLASWVGLRRRRASVSGARAGSL